MQDIEADIVIYKTAQHYISCLRIAIALKTKEYYNAPSSVELVILGERPNRTL